MDIGEWLLIRKRLNLENYSMAGTAMECHCRQTFTLVEWGKKKK